jgi:hypothetical protein
MSVDKFLDGSGTFKRLYLDEWGLAQHSSNKDILFYNHLLIQPSKLAHPHGGKVLTWSSSSLIPYGTRRRTVAWCYASRQAGWGQGVNGLYLVMGLEYLLEWSINEGMSQIQDTQPDARSMWSFDSCSYRRPTVRVGCGRSEDMNMTCVGAVQYQDIM